nr:unnamed protein product [Callosobruchus chinensis]
MPVGQYVDLDGILRAPDRLSFHLEQVVICACGELVFVYAVLLTSSPTYQKDADDDEGRPYEFGFTIDGEQHRHEKKDVVHDLKRGMHAVKRTSGTFNAVGCDLALEQSQNRSSAVTGGLIGIRKNEEAMQILWLLLYSFKNSVHSMGTSYLGIQSDNFNTFGDFDEAFFKRVWNFLLCLALTE